LNSPSFVLCRYGCSLLEFFTLEYAIVLLTHPSLWQLAPAYLASAPVFGGRFLQIFIEHQYIQSDTKAIKLLDTCEKYGLIDQWRVIHRVCMRCSSASTFVSLPPLFVVVVVVVVVVDEWLM
jgi:hypothetical protein